MARSAVGLVLLTLGVSLMAAPGSRAAFPGDSGLIVFSASPWPSASHLGQVRQGLYVVEPDGLMVRPLKTDAARMRVPRISSPAWSPDGSKVAYVRHHPEGARIEVINADGSGEHVIVPALPHGRYAPAWSPDGSLIAFVREDSVWIADADGQEARLVAHRTAHAPAWSPDCSRIAFTTGFGRDNEIRTVDADGRKRSVVNGGLDPDWSPDGRHLAFWVHDYFLSDVRTSVRVIGADGSGERVLAQGHGPAWSPDGREVVYDTRWGLRATPAEGGVPRILTADKVTLYREPDWQPLRQTPLDPNLCAAWRRDFIQPSLELSVLPRRAVAGRATRFRLHVTTEGALGAEGVPGAIVQFAGRRRSTDARGRTTVLRTFRRPGKRHLTAEKPGFFYGTTTLRVVRRR